MDSNVRKLVTDPMKDWPNDDLLMDHEGRNRVKEEFPALYPVLDWPKLRETFTEYEKIAVSSKIVVRKRGRLIVVLGVVGLLLAATTGLLPKTTLIAALMGGFAALFSFSSLVLGVLFRVRNPIRDQWLQSRYVAERLRHFYFHFLLTNSQVAISAMSSPDSRQSILLARDDALELFKFTILERK